ncbi:MAG: nickel-dependent lactate racemase [Planctomycetota bacterium]|nr:nickel-dependent lactate racemase [Planctomycetota bacterium]
MGIELHYGKNGYSLKLPKGCDATILRKPQMPLLEDPIASLTDSFQNCNGTPPLAECAQGCSSACIAICDITRPVPHSLLLRPLVQQLESGGIPRDRISIVVATGLHRPNEGEELAELIGDEWVLDNITIYNHDARCDAEHVWLGKTATRETVVSLDRRFVEADLRIATGLVEPHFMAGYSGGRKVVAPGLAHSETITTFHSARFMADPATRNCNLLRNPLHEEQLQIIQMLDAWTQNNGGFGSRFKNTLGLNTVLDEHRSVAQITFGEIISSHQEAVAFATTYCELPVDKPFDIVVSTAAGYPLDKTYYQTVKGMVGAMEILRQGGDLIIASECSEGMGSPEYVEAQRRLVAQGPEAFLQEILQKPHANIDEWQTQMQLKSQAIGRVHLYASGLSSEEQALTGVHCTDDLNRTLADLWQSNPQARIAVIPEGPYVVPRLTSAVT